MTTPEFNFNPPASRPISRNEKRAGLAEGYLQAEQAALAQGEAWIAMAAMGLRMFLAQLLPDQTFMAIEMRNWVMANTDVPEPTELRAWGSIIRLAQKEGLIISCGTVCPRHVHGRTVTLWKRKPGIVIKITCDPL